MLKIESIEAIPLWIPMSKTPSRRFSSDAGGTTGIALSVVFLHTAGGPTGLGYNAEIAARPSAEVAEYLNELAAGLVGQDALAPEALAHLVRLRAGAAGGGAIASQARSILDIACWDVLATEAGLPLHRVLGGFVGEVPAYGSGGRRGLSDADLVAECASFADRGLMAYKFKIGTNRDHDARRVALLRKEMGESFTLYADANQAYDVPEAIEVARMLGEHAIAWFEEPVRGDAADLTAAVAGASPVPIAAGESCYDLAQFAALCEQRSVSFIQPDLGRCGGVSGFRKISHLAEAFGISLASHLAHELSAGLVASSPAGHTVEASEHMPEDVWVTPVEFREGKIVLADVPGHGVELAAEARRLYALP